MYDRCLVFRERELLHDVFSSCFKALIVKLFCFVDERVNNEDLTPEGYLVTHELIQCRSLAFGRVYGLYRLSSRRELVDYGYVQISVQGHRKSTWNRGRGHHEHMWRSSA